MVLKKTKKRVSRKHSNYEVKRYLESIRHMVLPIAATVDYKYMHSLICTDILRELKGRLETVLPHSSASLCGANTHALEFLGVLRLHFILGTVATPMYSNNIQNPMSLVILGTPSYDSFVHEMKTN